MPLTLPIYIGDKEHPLFRIILNKLFRIILNKKEKKGHWDDPKPTPWELTKGQKEKERKNNQYRNGMILKIRDQETPETLAVDKVSMLQHLFHGDSCLIPDLANVRFLTGMPQEGRIVYKSAS